MEQAVKLARIVPMTGGGRIGKALTYKIPQRFQGAIDAGSVAAIPIRNSMRIGVVTSFEEENEIHKSSPYKIRELVDVYTEECLLSRKDINVARWMGSYYACGLADALSPFSVEIKALQVTAVFITEEPSKILEAIDSLGLLFNLSDNIKFEKRDDGKYRIVKTSLIETLKAGGLSEEKVLETIRAWIIDGIITEELSIRPKSQQLGKSGYIALTEAGRNADKSALRSQKQIEVVQLLESVGGILSKEEVIREIPAAKTTLKALIQKGFLEEIVDDSLLPFPKVPKQSNIELSPAQIKALQPILNALENRKHAAFLLFGVTGSGKTEVYIEACRRAIALGMGVTVLVPEIALTHQAVRRFMQAFPMRIALLHSELTERERLHEWRLVRRGKRDIIIGARSALFAPVPNRGLIIIDEESESAYKQQQRPRYNARDVARKMAKEENSVLLLGSATPSVETFHTALKGGYQLLRLPDRVVGGALPEVHIVCPKILSKKGIDNGKSMIVDGREVQLNLISPELYEELVRTLELKRQAMLFLNLRGFARSLICIKCGWVRRCPNCEVSLTYHRRERTQACHHCGHTEVVNYICSKCGHDDMRYLGWGTERLEAEVRALFPSVRMMRMDRDTVSSRGLRRHIVEAMQRGDIDILVGTQMIAKGLDFPAVRLVGVISADQSLHIPDFRAAERTFQLITQVIGRAGRSDALEREGGGIAIIQSYDPDNRVLRTACSQDYEAFYENEIKLRFRFGYPPAVHLGRIVISGVSKDEVRKFATEFAEELKLRKPENDVFLLGPVPAPMEKLEGKWRFHMILKASKVSTIIAWLQEVKWRVKKKKNIKLEIDIDPLMML